MNLKKYIVEIYRNLYQNKMSYIINATLLQMIMIIISTFYLSFLFQLMLIFSNETQLNKENFLHIISTPINIIITLIFIFSFAFLMFIEFSFLTLLIYGHYKKETYSLKSIIRSASKTYRQLFGFQLLFFIFYFILTMPLANLGMSSILTEGLYIPKFITGEIMKTPIGLGIYSLTMIILAFVNYRLILVMPLTMLSDYTLSQSIKQSWILTRRHPYKLLMVIVILQAGLLSSMVAIVSLIITFFSIIDPQGNHFITSSLLFITLKALIFCGTVMVKLILVSTLVYYLMNQVNITKNLDVIPARSYSWIFKVIATILLATASIASMYEFRNDSFNKKIEIIGHRGFVKEGVENSIESLKAARKMDVDYVEMDIVMTKDHQFAVIHDNELNRLAKIDNEVQNMNLSDLKKLTITQDNHISKIMSLQQAVRQAKHQNTKLLIELKPYGKEPSNYIDILINELKNLDVMKDAKLMSLDYQLMEDIKKRKPDIECGYIIPFQIGDLPKSNLDFYLIEDFSYSPNLVIQAHKMHKQLYVWTVNGEEDITKYLNSQIDGIITDDADIVKKKKNEFLYHNKYFERALRILTY